MSEPERILLVDDAGIPTASVDALQVYDTALMALRAMFDHIDDQKAAADVLARACDAEGPAGSLVATTALLALVPIIGDLARRHKAAIGSEASVVDVIFGREG
ncbi:hypothetical protein CEJ39_17170 [Rhodococcus pyridinivorans]|uniref:hypothetical protein n=1 Tax=Rhodococcus pyridinivorans TaxID=103816 RepID=UPI00030DE6A9|nr:hypothetical protein [Rhodococcus pyridinivorans]AWZ25665.1 hypothetical protein CEJ39_17170 [Rhodococcus pyridinivorans]UGQ59879.1 hypothetical protein LSF60_10615 [Rhodococcus pyridinivorans]